MREPLREPSREPIREPIREHSREPIREPMRESMREPAREPMRDPVRESQAPVAPYTPSSQFTSQIPSQIFDRRDQGAPVTSSYDFSRQEPFRASLDTKAGASPMHARLQMDDLGSKTIEQEEKFRANYLQDKRSEATLT